MKHVEPDQALGAAVRRLRSERGMTQETLARCTRVTVPTLCRLECGVYYPNWRTIRRLATGLGITLAELMTAVEACEG